MNPVENIVILGGGTAGWLTAMTVQKVWPKSKVTLIEGPDGSSTAAAGESAPSILFRLFERLGIDTQEMLSKTDATFKSGSVFTNWRGEGEQYYSPNLNSLHPVFKAENYFFGDLGIHTSSTHFWNWAAVTGKDFSSFGAGALMRQHLAPLVRSPDGSLVAISDYSMHFNAVKNTAHLRELGLARGIHRTVANVVDVTYNDGKISSLKLADDTLIDVDFAFDCSGFRRYLIGEKLGAKWNDYSKFLTVDIALPFFPPMGESIPPYTEAIAMKHGWMWRVPLRDRYGSGYNFDSRFCTLDQAKREVEEYLGHPVDFLKPIPYKAGCFDTPWVGNCIAVGLAASFLEPLSSSNLSTVALQLFRLIDDAVTMRTLDERDIASFNRYFVEMHHKLMSFAYYHYMTGRSDTEFWRQFGSVDHAPEPIRKKLTELSSRVPARDFYTSGYLSAEGPEVWISVDAGIKTRLEPYRKSVEAFGNQDLLADVYERLCAVTDDVIKAAMPHRACLELIDKSVRSNP